MQTAYFAPKGLFGLVYWYLLYPIHGFIFSRLIRALARAPSPRLGQPRRKFGGIDSASPPSWRFPAGGQRRSPRTGGDRLRCRSWVQRIPLIAPGSECSRRRPR